MSPTHDTTLALLAFIDASPTPYHCVEQTAQRLAANGFERLREEERWQLRPNGLYFIARGGALAAFRCGQQAAAEAGFRLIGAHTDSPTLRLKPSPDVGAHGYNQLGIEVYGGTLTHTWLDRDLGLAGRVVLRKGAGVKPSTRLVHIARPILRIPSLAIHLYPELREDGLKLNSQKHLAPIWAVMTDPTAKDSGPGHGLLRTTVALELAVNADDILAWDLCLCDTTKSTIGGLRQDLIFAPRLDNQTMCYAGIEALLRAAKTAATDATQVVCLYDHEEVGSESVGGAGGAMATDLLRRLAESEGPGAESSGLPRATARSYQVSADMAHAVHPNYDEKHDPQHLPRLNGGPVIKINASQRYATCAETAGLFENLCRDAEVPYQKFANRSDLRCGTTIGPISSARLGIRTVDVGNAMLSMHSIRELAGAHDPERMISVMQRFLST